MFRLLKDFNNNFDAMIGHVGLDDPIDSTSGSRMIHTAAEFGNLHVIDHLIAGGATLDMPDENKRTALDYAAVRDRADAFHRLLPHIDIEKLDVWGDNPISTAAQFGSARFLSAYLAEEADANRLSDVLLHRNNQGDTPLMIAARHWQPEALCVLLQLDLGDLGDPSAEAHRSKDSDTLFHRVFRGSPGKTPTEADRFRARTIVEILLRDQRLDPNLPNDKGETPFDLGGAFPEARRALRQDMRVPKDYATMTPAMRIEDLSSRRPATVLRLLKEAPQALTDEHEQAPERRAGVSTRSKGKPLSSAEASAGETGLEILIRLKNHGVLATLSADPVHWPALRKEFQKLIAVAAVPSADRLRVALLRRFSDGEIGANEAGELLGASVDAGDTQTARALVEKGAALTLSRDGRGNTVLHRAAIAGDADRFRSVLAIGPFALPRDNWGRRPSDLAAERLAATFHALEADMEDPTEEKASSKVSSAIAGQPPFLRVRTGRRGSRCR